MIAIFWIDTKLTYFHTISIVFLLDYLSLFLSNQVTRNITRSDKQRHLYIRVRVGLPHPLPFNPLHLPPYLNLPFLSIIQQLDASHHRWCQRLVAMNGLPKGGGRFLASQHDQRFRLSRLAKVGERIFHPGKDVDEYCLTYMYLHVLFTPLSNLWICFVNTYTIIYICRIYTTCFFRWGWELGRKCRRFCWLKRGLFHMWLLCISEILASTWTTDMGWIVFEFTWLLLLFGGKANEKSSLIVF